MNKNEKVGSITVNFGGDNEPYYKAWNMGYSAGFSGKPTTVCSFIPGTASAKVWAVGYRAGSDAKQER